MNADAQAIVSRVDCPYHRWILDSIFGAGNAVSHAGHCVAGDGESDDCGSLYCRVASQNVRHKAGV